MSTRREFYLEEIKRQCDLLKVEGNAYGFVVKTVALDAEHYENLEDRSRLPAVHIMHGMRGTKREAGQAQGRHAMLNEVTEVMPILIRGTVMGPQAGESSIDTKSVQILRLHAAIERVLSRDVLDGMPGVDKTYFEDFSFPGVRESWGSSFAIIEFNLYIIHTYEGGTSP